MNDDDNVHHRRQATGCCYCRWAFAQMVVVVEEELLSVDGIQIEHVAASILKNHGTVCSATNS